MEITKIVTIKKGVLTNIKFRIYDDYTTLNPVDLTIYRDFICAITEDGRTLIEKKYSTNDIKIISDSSLITNLYILSVKFKPQDTINLNINPPSEERMRTLEIFAIDKNDNAISIITTQFYLEGSGYYVR